MRVFCHKELLGNVEEVHALLCPKWNRTLGSSCLCHQEKLHMVFTLPMVRRFT